MPAALWTLAALWISVDPLTGTHSGPVARWTGNIALLLVAAASSVLIVWLIRAGTPERPRDEYTSVRAFELGYAAGHADATAELRAEDEASPRPVFDLITGTNGKTSRTGT